MGGDSKIDANLKSTHTEIVVRPSRNPKLRYQVNPKRRGF